MSSGGSDIREVFFRKVYLMVFAIVLYWIAECSFAFSVFRLHMKKHFTHASMLEQRKVYELVVLRHSEVWGWSDIFIFSF